MHACRKWINRVAPRVRDQKRFPQPLGYGIPFRSPACNKSGSESGVDLAPPTS
jgi:hypothetical protein